MGSLGSPKIWVPYISTKDCSQGFCSLYCPQWCYIPAPPPPSFEFPEDDSGPNFSPLVIAIIGILASAFLLVSYYTIISKYCGNMERERRENQDRNEELEENQDAGLHEPWHVQTTGLDEALIKSITVCKYKKEEGLVDGTDCSVCLSEFEEDESLRLLPKCSHAFHVQCIDTWLKTHSNCPLCRANIVTSIVEELEIHEPSSQQSQIEHENVAAGEDLERAAEEDEVIRIEPTPKTPSRGFRDFGNSDRGGGGGGGATIIEIRDEGGEQHIRRSVSLDYSCQDRLSIADILRLNEEEEQPHVDGCDCQFGSHVGSSKVAPEEMSKNSSHRNRVLQCVMSPVSMKRSFSSGRLLFTRHGRGRDGIIPTLEIRID